MRKLNLVLCYGLALLLFGCASTETAELASTDDLDAAVAELAAKGMLSVVPIVSLAGLSGGP